MYSTASPPPKKEGAKSITPSGIKGGKPPTVWQRLSVFYQIIPVGATAEQKSGRISCRFLRREAPLRRGYFKSVPQAHRNYSLFTFHYSFFFTRSCARVKNQGIPPQFRGSPGNRRPRLSLDADRAHNQGKCTGHMHAAGSENYAGHKNQGIPLSFGDCQGTAPRKGGYHSKAGRVPGREGFSR